MNFARFFAGLLFLTGTYAAHACQFDTDCNVGSKCVKTAGSLYGFPSDRGFRTHAGNTGTGQEKTSIRLKIPTQKGAMWASPLPPFEYHLTRNGESVDFAEELENIATERSAADVHTYIHRLVNLLYAAPDGIPHLDAEELSTFLERKRAVVRRALLAYLLIDANESADYRYHLAAERVPLTFGRHAP